MKMIFLCIKFYKSSIYYGWVYTKYPDTKLKNQPYLIDGIRVDNYLNVNLESLTSGNKVSFFTSHLEKYSDKDFVKEIMIDGVDYELIPKQK